MIKLDPEVQNLITELKQVIRANALLFLIIVVSFVGAASFFVWRFNADILPNEIAPAYKEMIIRDYWSLPADKREGR